jgi:hypothetical protein
MNERAEGGEEPRHGQKELDGDGDDDDDLYNLLGGKGEGVVGRQLG